MGTKKGGARKGKAKGSRLAYDDTKKQPDEFERDERKFKRTGRSGGKQRRGNYGLGPEKGWGKTIGYMQRLDEAILILLDIGPEVKRKGGNVAENIEKLIMRKYGESPEYDDQDWSD